MEPDLIPYSAVEAIAAHSVIVLAPHPDDEVFGCGGAIAAHAHRGVPVHVVILTDGAGAGDPALRAQESSQAAAMLGCAAPEFWGVADRTLLCSEPLQQRLLETLQRHGADLLYAPSPWEVHPDHRQACAMAMQVVQRLEGRVRLAFYEVGVPLRPNLLLDMTAHLPAKRAAMQCFASQVLRQDYARQIEALNTYRTYTLPRQVLAAEAYRVVSADQLVSGELAGQLHMASATVDRTAQAPSASGPLVSILIRSVGRHHLARALDSVATQTYPRIEVTVVAASSEHPPLPGFCGPFPIHLHQTQEALPRSKAANNALDVAPGDLLLFLDDDDWLMPDHVSRLVRALQTHPAALAAYAGVALVDDGGTPLGQVFDLPFDRTQMHAGNLMPIHAVLFDRALLSKGCRFDETLDRYEDWDFWLQVVRHTVMVHVPGISAAYVVHASSGVHEEAGPRSAHTQRIYAKHSPQWAEEDWAALMERNWAYPELARQHNADQHAQQALGALQIASAALTRQLAAMTESRSWRITAPLRKASARWSAAQRLAKRTREIVSTEGFAGVRYRIVQKLHAPVRYDAWMRRDRQATLASSAAMRAESHDWHARPLLSIVMPVYNPPLNLLREAVESIQAQVYEHWELCIADDASPDPGVWECLQQFCQADARVRAVRRTRNGHISQASNSALELVTGEFIVLMDNDDLLPPDALYWVADAIRRHPTAQILYSDEDKIDSSGTHFGPYFKSDWNHALFLGHNMISHLGVYRTDLVRRMGGFRQGYEGSQDYDLALRCIEHIAHSDIIHIPKVLYHWRAIEGSTALATGEKPYAVDAAQRALTDHLARTGLPGHITVSSLSNYVCERPFPQAHALSLILVGAHDGNAPWIDRLRSSLPLVEVQCCSDITTAFGHAREAKGSLVAIVRSGLVPDTDTCLSSMAGWAADNDVGIVAGSVRTHEGSLAAGGLVLHPALGCTPLLPGLPKGNPGYMGRGTLTQELSAVAWDCIVLRRSVLEASGCPDAALGGGDLAATAYCLQLRAAGLKVLWCPEASWSAPAGYHREKTTRVQRARFDQHVRPVHRALLERDPAYHPALRGLPADFTLIAN